MKKRSILAMLLAISLLLALTACGGGETAASSAASGETASSAAEESAGEEASTPAAEVQEEASVPEDVPEESAEEEAAPASAITYPLADAASFTMVCIARNNVLNVIGDEPFSSTPAYTALSEATGCEIEFTMLGEATATEKINIMVSSGDLSDLYTNIGTYGSNLTGAITDGILLDVAPYMDDCAPDYKALLESDSALYATAYNEDGTLCSFVSQAADLVTKGMLIRQDWLDDLGLEVPTNREDLEDVLRAFQSEKGATMPILVNDGLESGLTASFNVAFAGFREIGYQLTEPDGDTVVAALASENFIEYLNYLNYLYNEGLVIDDFMSTSRENGNWESSYYGGKCGVWADGYRELDPANRSNADDPNYVVSAFALSDYECHVSERSTVSMDGVVYISAACEAPEAAIKMMNYLYTEEGRLIPQYGVKDESYTIDENGEVQFTDAVLNNPDGLTVSNALIWYGATQWLPSIADDHYYELVCSEEAYTGIEYWTEAYGDRAMQIPSGVSMTTEETTEYNTYANDVLTQLTEAAVRRVTGAIDEEGYREMIKDAEDMGLARMTELYQAAYDRYLDAA